MRACVRACVHACARVCVCPHALVHVCMHVCLYPPSAPSPPTHVPVPPPPAPLPFRPQSPHNHHHPLQPPHLYEDDTVAGVDEHDVDVAPVLHGVGQGGGQVGVVPDPLQQVVVLQSADDEQRLLQLRAQELQQQQQTDRQGTRVMLCNVMRCDVKQYL